ncbi:MAG: trigger factor [Bacilli bacterium]|nr:trigger factor [Bacilli bacterium]
MAKKENKNIHEVTVKIEGKDWENALDKAFQEKQKTVKVDGFRKGKVPRNIYEKKFGKESLYLDAANIVVPQAYDKAMKDSKLEPVVQPSVDIKDIDEKGVEFVFEITTKPEVKIKKYKGLKIKPEKVAVTEEEINHELGHLLERYMELSEKENQTVEEKNVAIIDFEGKKDGVAFDGGKGENYSLEIGSHTFIPGFEEQLIGMKVGEEKDIDLTFPEDYHAKDLAGANVVFHVKVNEVKEKKARDLDKEFFEDLGMEGIDSEEKLKEEIKKSIHSRKEANAENEYVDHLLEEVSKNVEVDIPEKMVEEELDRIFTRFEGQMKMQGISLDLYYQFTNTSEKDLKSQMEKEAYKNVLYRLMLEELRVVEKQEVTDEEAEKEAEKLAKDYKMEKEEFLKEFGGLDLVKYDLEMRKVIELLKEYNK